MSTQWKPGDVAMVIREDGTESRAIMSRWSSHWHAFESGAQIVDARPLAVIDPEDKEAVERLSSLTEANGGPTFFAGDVGKLQAALREFANPKPPRPEEPTGLGAVVEDVWGHRFVRVGARAWRNVNEDSFCIWLHIDVVRVLSEGYLPDGEQP